MQGLSLYRREAIWSDFKEDHLIKEYAENTIENDCIELKKLYGFDRLEDRIANVIEKKTELLSRNLSKISSCNELFENKSEKIKTTLNQFVKNQITYSHLLEEEQELELEIEQEEEKELERPALATPYKNRSIDIDVKNFVELGIFNENSESFLPISKSLNESSSKKILEPNAWSNQLFVTRDFTRTVQAIDEIDDYLRPPRWFCINKTIILFLSDYETNELFDYFNPKETALATLLPRLRENQERIISFPPLSVPKDLMEQMAIFAGSLFFNNNDEQSEFLSFTGYCPSPRDDVQQKLFDDAVINQNGFVSLQNRSKVFGNTKLSKFKDDPCDLLTKLYEIRNYGIVPTSVHHLKIFRSGKRIPNSEFPKNKN